MLAAASPPAVVAFLASSLRTMGFPIDQPTELPLVQELVLLRPE